jgi:tRNA1(Val) A37 N6-methylase TrmN6
MRQVELQKTESSDTIIKEEFKKPEGEDAKKIKKQIQYVERDIEKLEKDILAIEIILSDPNFYNDAKYLDTNKKYKLLKDNLDDKMLNWENLAFELEGVS